MNCKSIDWWSLGTLAFDQDRHAGSKDSDVDGCGDTAESDLFETISNVIQCEGTLLLSPLQFQVTMPNDVEQVGC